MNHFPPMEAFPSVKTAQQCTFMRMKNLNHSRLCFEVFPCFTLSVKRKNERTGNQLLVRDKFRAGEIHRSKRLRAEQNKSKKVEERESMAAIRSKIKRVKTAREETDTQFDG